MKKVSENDQIKVKTMRIWESDHLRISQFCKENEITQADWIEHFNNYSTINKVDSCEEIEVMKLKGDIIRVEKENKVFQKLLDYRNQKIQLMQKQIFKLEQEKIQLEYKNKELEIRSKI